MKGPQFTYKSLDGNTHPSMHCDLGRVCKVSDGRIGIVQSIGSNWVSVGGGFDFGLWESEVFAKEDARIIGVIAV